MENTVALNQNLIALKQQEIPTDVFPTFSFNPPSQIKRDHRIKMVINTLKTIPKDFVYKSGLIF